MPTFMLVVFIFMSADGEMMTSTNHQSIYFGKEACLVAKEQVNAELDSLKEEAKRGDLIVQYRSVCLHQGD